MSRKRGWGGLGPSVLLRNLLFFSFLLAAARSTNAEEPPKVALERVVDGRGNRVCDIARASVKTGEARVHVRLVRGLVRSDLILRHAVRLGADGKQIAVDEIWLGDGPPMRFEGGGPGGRVSASSPASTFRYFEQDAARKTVRCNLARLAEETDHALLSAAADYIEQGLEDDGLAPEELAILTLHAVKKRPPPPSPPTRNRVEVPDDAPEAESLRIAVLAALEAPR